LTGCETGNSAAARRAWQDEERWEKILAKAARENQPMLVTPLVGVGPITFGMTFDEVKRVLGEPDLHIGQSYQYRLGFSLVPKRGEEKVVMIMAGGPCKGDDLLVAAFKGRTKEGIGMNSTRKDIIAAFGPPTRTEDWSGPDDPQVEYLHYNALGMNLTLRRDRLVHMALRAPPTPSQTNAPADK
jgi:hypothetical protein